MAEVVVEVPRTGEEQCPSWTGPSSCSPTSTAVGTFVRDGRHAWLRLVPEKINSWDFRKQFDQQS